MSRDLVSIITQVVDTSMHRVSFEHQHREGWGVVGIGAGQSGVNICLLVTFISFDDSENNYCNIHKTCPTRPVTSMGH